MSLDSVELLVDIENTFGIQISDLEAEKIVTVGDFYDCILRKLEILSIEGCVSQKLFYRFRRILADKYDLAIQQIHPNTKLDEIIPKIDRKQEWFELERRFQLKLPELVRPKWMQKAINLSAIVLSILPIILFFAIFRIQPLNFWFFILPILIFLLSKVLISELTQSFCYQFKLDKLKDLIKIIHTENFNKLNLTLNNKEDILAILIGTISEKCGIDVQEINLESSITNDLGID